MRSFKNDKLEVKIYENRTLMGAAAAEEISAKIKELLLWGSVRFDDPKYLELARKASEAEHIRAAYPMI